MVPGWVQAVLPPTAAVWWHSQTSLLSRCSNNNKWMNNLQKAGVCFAFDNSCVHNLELAQGWGSGKKGTTVNSHPFPLNIVQNSCGSSVKMIYHDEFIPVPGRPPDYSSYGSRLRAAPPSHVNCSLVAQCLECFDVPVVSWHLAT